jgi:hypothetical protein
MRASEIVLGILMLFIVAGWAMIVNPPSSWVGRNRNRERK